MWGTAPEMYETFYDHHVHSAFSWDSESYLDDLLEASRKVGLHGLVVTDHLEFDPADPGFGEYDYEVARNAWAELAEANPGMPLRFGAEVTHRSKFSHDIRQFLHNRRFHWVIGSVHHVGFEEVHAFMERVEGEGEPLEECLEPYFVENLATVESNLYDCLGHLDFPKRFSRRGPSLTAQFWMKHYAAPIRRILTACLDLGVFLEVNTATFRRGFNEPMPGWAILEEYRRLGGREVVLSSDAHRPEDVATAFGVMLHELPRLGLSARNGVV
jgi:histidinol-phosphatase (PHP family)